MSMQIKLLLRFFIFLIINLNYRCVPVDDFEDCIIQVNGRVFTINQQPINGATVQIDNTYECCAAEEKPCTYKTDLEGNWSLKYESGFDDTDNCSVTVLKEGYTTKTEVYQYTCTEKNATVAVEVNVILEEDLGN